MNPYMSICFSALLLSGATHAQTASSPSRKPFGIKSGRIVYSFFDITASGERILTFDDWGSTYKEEITTVQDTNILKAFLMGTRGMSKSAPDSLFNMKMRAVQRVQGTCQYQNQLKFGYLIRPADFRIYLKTNAKPDLL